MNDSRMRLDIAAGEASVRLAEQNIFWILERPSFSQWLKDALRGGMTCEPERLANDLEILTHVLRGWASACIERDLLKRREACAGSSVNSSEPG